MPFAGEATSPFRSQERLSGNQRMLIALVGLSSMLEFWDAYLIGFIMTFLVKPWGLTFGTMGTVLLASGIGAVVGGLFWGALADMYGRKPVFLISLMLTAFASLCLAFTPDGDWLYMAILRVLVGFGTGGFFIQVGLVQEFVPPARRGMLTGVVSAITTGGLLLGSFSGAFLVPVIGWRGTFALGAAPAVLALIAAFVLPESPRWLLLRGRTEQARRAAEWALGRPLAAGEMEAAVQAPPAPSATSAFQIFRHPRNVATSFLINVGLLAGYYGIVLWSPTLLGQIEQVTPAKASQFMIGFSVLGVLSRLTAAYAADRIGRRRTGGVFALGAAAAILLAGLVGHGTIGSPRLFWLPLLLGFTLADGSFSVCALYSAEIWPSRLRGSGAGFGGAAGSLGKIIGPLGLALVAGSNSLVMPKATAAVIQPAFIFLSVCLLVCGLTYLLLGFEAKNRSLESIDQNLDAQTGPPVLAGAAGRAIAN